MDDLLKVIVAEDHAPSLQLLLRLIDTFPRIEVIRTAVDGEDLLEKVVEEEPHIVLVDINMPKMSGMEAIKKCQAVLPDLRVIFTTGNEEYAIEAFQMDAVDYILKPIARDRLYLAIEKARKEIQVRNRERLARLQVHQEKINKLIVRSDREIHFLPLKDIVYIVKEGRKSIITTLHEQVEVYETIGSLSKRLSHTFIQSHRSYIINLEHVSTIKPSGETFLVTFAQHPDHAYISRNRLNDIMELFEC